MGRGLGLGSSLEKHFCPQNDVWVHFDADFDWQKTPTVTRSLGTRTLRFNRETQLTKTVQKVSKNSRSDQRGRGGRAIVSHLITPLDFWHIQTT